MLNALTLIFCCQLAGELCVKTTGLPMPGPVFGMVLLFAGLMIRGGVPDTIAAVGNALLGNLSLLFIPAGVGVMLHLKLIGTELLPISAALIGSTLITVAVTGLMMQCLSKGSRGADETETNGDAS